MQGNVSKLLQGTKDCMLWRAIIHETLKGHRIQKRWYLLLPFFFAEIAYVDQAIIFLFKFRQRESM